MFMKKLEFANIVCEVSVTENYKMFSEVTCEYEKDNSCLCSGAFLSAAAAVSVGNALWRAGRSVRQREEKEYISFLT